MQWESGKLPSEDAEALVTELLDHWKVDIYAVNSYLFRIPEKRIEEQRNILRRQLLQSSPFGLAELSPASHQLSTSIPNTPWEFVMSVRYDTPEVYETHFTYGRTPVKGRMRDFLRKHGPSCFVFLPAQLCAYIPGCTWFHNHSVKNSLAPSSGEGWPYFVALALNGQSGRRVYNPNRHQNSVYRECKECFGIYRGDGHFPGSSNPNGRQVCSHFESSGPPYHAPTYKTCWRTSFRWHLEQGHRRRAKMLQIVEGQEGKLGKGQEREAVMAEEIGIPVVRLEFPTFSRYMLPEEIWSRIREQLKRNGISTGDLHDFRPTAAKRSKKVNATRSAFIWAHDFERLGRFCYRCCWLNKFQARWNMMEPGLEY